MATHSSTLAWKIHGQRSLVGCSPWGREESDMTERLHFHFSLSRIGEGNGNPLQCSCLENPRDGGTWWAAICGVAQSWTRLKQLSSSDREDPMEQEMAAHSSVLAWEISWTEEPSGLQHMESQRDGHDIATEHPHNNIKHVLNGGLCANYSTYIILLDFLKYICLHLRTHTTDISGLSFSIVENE